MTQTAQAELRTQQNVANVAAKPPPKFRLVPAPIQEAIRPGSVLLVDTTVLPPSLHLDVRAAGKWNLVTSDDSTAISRKLAQAGWNFSFIVPAADSAAIAVDQQRALLKALNDIVRQVEAKGFNAVEIVDVQTKRRLGRWTTRLRAHPRHIRNSPYITDPDPSYYPTGLWDFTRIFTVRDRKTPQMKAI